MRHTFKNLFYCNTFSEKKKSNHCSVLHKLGDLFQEFMGGYGVCGSYMSAYTGHFSEDGVHSFHWILNGSCDIKKLD